jgi:hypothetical protein
VAAFKTSAIDRRDECRCKAGIFDSRKIHQTGASFLGGKVKPAVRR